MNFGGGISSKESSRHFCAKELPTADRKPTSTNSLVALRFRGAHAAIVALAGGASRNGRTKESLDQPWMRMPPIVCVVFTTLIRRNLIISLD
jgi:hypothetical protein